MEDDRGPGEIIADDTFFYQLDSLGSTAFDPSMTTSAGAVVKGKDVYVGLVTKPKGTGSQPHRHQFEQFNYVLKGTLKAWVGGKEQLVSAGGLIHIPENTLHSIITTPEEDAVFLMVKKVTPFGTGGTAEDPSVRGPRYEDGFGEAARD